MDARSERWLVIANVAVGLLAGVALFLVPSAFLSVLGIQVDAAGFVFARLYGAELAGFNVATWMSRRTPVAGPIVVGHVVNESLTAVALGLAALAGVGNTIVWLVALAATMFAVGYGVIAVQRGRATFAVADR